MAGFQLKDGTLGEIGIDVDLENPFGRVLFDRGHEAESGIRRARVEDVVDTGAVMSMPPRNVVERLGLATQRTARVRYTEERSEEREMAGPLAIRIGDRFMNTDCIVGPPSGDPLIGRTVLAALDLVADRANRALAPRPESPDYPLLNLK